MSPGKAASQAGHAFKMVTYQNLKTNPENFERYLEGGIGTNVCLVAKNLRQIEAIIQECEEQKIPHSLIIDEGHIHPPHFDGSPIVTALGVGPIFENPPKSLKRLSVYK